jgi:hypothetical protein
MDILRTRSTRKTTAAAGLFAVAVVMTISASLPKAAPQTLSTSSRSAHQKLEARQLLMAINGVGDTCGAVTRAFLRGVERATPAVFWGAACSNGATYQVRVTADRVRVTNCTLLNAEPTACFSPLTESAILLDKKNTAFREATRSE